MEEEELARTLKDVGIQDGNVSKVLTINKKMEIDSPERLYQVLNLSNVTGVKTLARALLAVFGEEGRKFMKAKSEEQSNTMRQGNKREWEDVAQGAEIDKMMNDMAKAAKMKMMMNVAGMNNGNQGQNQSQPMAEEPLMKNGKFVMDDNGNMVTRKVPVQDGGSGSGMSEAMITLMTKMMEMNQNAGQQNMQAFAEMFKVLTSEGLSNDSDKLVELEREIADAKEKMTKKELEMRDERIQSILGDLADEVQKTKQMANKDPVEDVQKVKRQAEALKEVGALGEGSEDKDSWRRRVEEENMKRQHEIQKKGLDTIENAAKSIGKPIAGAVGQGVKESIVKNAGESGGSESEQVSNMLNKVKEQKKRAAEQAEQKKTKSRTDEIIDKSEEDYDKSLEEIEVN